jgi:hypothetical protein
LYYNGATKNCLARRSNRDDASSTTRGITLLRNGQKGGSVGSGRGCYRNDAQVGSRRHCPITTTHSSPTSPIGIVVRYVWRQAH